MNNERDQGRILTEINGEKAILINKKIILIGNTVNTMI